MSVCCKHAFRSSSASRLSSSASVPRTRLLNDWQRRNGNVSCERSTHRLTGIRTKRTSAGGGSSGGTARSRHLRRLSKSAKRDEAEGDWVYGLRPVDYSTAPPPQICVSPPPPPPKPGLAKYTFPVSAALTVAVTLYFYFNNQNDSFAYWEAMQTGGTVPGEEDDDEDNFDDDAKEE